MVSSDSRELEMTDFGFQSSFDETETLDVTTVDNGRTIYLQQHGH
jgi:hypothetical protein